MIILHHTMKSPWYNLPIDMQIHGLRYDYIGHMRNSYCIFYIKFREITQNYMHSTLYLCNNQVVRLLWFLYHFDSSKRVFFSEDESLLMRSLFINECILYFSWEWGFSHLGCQPNRFYNLMNLNTKIWNFHLATSWIIAINLVGVRLICHIFATKSMKFPKNWPLSFFVSMMCYDFICWRSI